MLQCLKREPGFYQYLWGLTGPIALQNLITFTLGLMDTLMVSWLGNTQMAAVTTANVPVFLLISIVFGVQSGLSILVSQYWGKRDMEHISRAIGVAAMLGTGLTVVLAAVLYLWPVEIMDLLSNNHELSVLGAPYLKLIGISYVFNMLSSLYVSARRSAEDAGFGMKLFAMSTVLNTGLNYLLIFGHGGLPALGVQGAAVASVAAQVVSCLLVYLFLAVRLRKKQWRLRFTLGFTRPELLTYAKILLPLLASEFLWSLGENVYSAIYGNIGTQACAAMTMTTPIQCLMVGALSGLSKAAAILIGKSLGTQEYDRAYRDAQRLMRCGLAASLVLSALLLVFGRLYTTIYRVEPEVRATAYLLLVVFAVISPVKVQNMILGGGILKSGGKTNYTLAIDLFGVPLGFLAAFVLKLPVAPVYFLLSLEECVRLALSLRLFKKRSWMQQL